MTRCHALVFTASRAVEAQCVVERQHLLVGCTLSTLLVFRVTAASPRPVRPRALPRNLHRAPRVGGTSVQRRVGSFIARSKRAHSRLPWAPRCTSPRRAAFKHSSPGGRCRRSRRSGAPLGTRSMRSGAIRVDDSLRFSAPRSECPSSSTRCMAMGRLARRSFAPPRRLTARSSPSCSASVSGTGSAPPRRPMSCSWSRSPR